MTDDVDGRIGVVSDTHGLLRSDLFGAFRDVDRILHAGDVGEPAFLDDLSVVAPVTAVWGNVDGSEVRRRTDESAEGTTAGLRWAVIHGHQVGDYAELPSRFPGAALVVHGHSHVPAARRVDGALLLNPGSAGPRRMGKPVTAALVEVQDGRPEVRHLDLLTGGRYDLDQS